MLLHQKQKQKIRSAVKDSLIEDSITIGKSVIAKKLLSYGLKLEDPSVTKKLKEFNNMKKIKDMNELFVQYSLSKINILEILNFFKIDIKNKVKVKKTPPLIDSSQAIVVGGNDNVMVRFAKCCSPIFGDEILGYITIGRGISIHRISV